MQTVTSVVYKNGIKKCKTIALLLKELIALLRGQNISLLNKITKINYY